MRAERHHLDFALDLAGGKLSGRVQLTVRNDSDAPVTEVSLLLNRLLRVTDCSAALTQKVVPVEGLEVLRVKPAADRREHGDPCAENMNLPRASVSAYSRRYRRRDLESPALPRRQVAPAKDRRPPRGRSSHARHRDPDLDRRHGPQRMMAGMKLRSLGLRSDLFFLRRQALVEDRGDYLIGRSPDEPGYHWGNLLIFPGPPKSGDLARWMGFWETEFGGDSRVRHVTFAWDGTDGDRGASEEFETAGFEFRERVGGLERAP